MVLVKTCRGSVDKDILKNLGNYTNLSLIFNRAQDNKVQLNNENPIIRNCQINNEASRSFLTRIDLALSILNVQTLNAKHFNSLMKRLTSPVSNQSFAILSELDILLHLIASVGIQNVSYQYVVNGKTPDYKISAGGKDIIFELISLQERMPIAHITNIFKGISEKLIASIDKKDYYIRLDLDTANLKLKEEVIRGEKQEIIDEEESLNFMLEHLRNLHLENLIGLDCALDFDVRTNEKITINDFIRVFPDQDLDLVKYVDKWTGSVRLDDLIIVPIRSVIVYKLEGKECVEVASVDRSSDSTTSTIPGLEASKRQKQSFRDQIRRSTYEKRNKAQRETGKPSIIIIETRLDDWQYQYESDDDDFLVLKNEIKQELRNITEISGVIIFYSNLYQGRYVENKFADKKIKIQLQDLEKMNILEPQEKTLIDEDLVINKNEDPVRQLVKMRRCISVENEITSQSDKIRLLMNIQVFLAGQYIDEDILNEIERIIIKYAKDEDKRTYTEILAKESNSLIDLGRNVRAETVFCLYHFWRHRFSSSHIHIIEKLSEDESLRVKSNIVKGLPTIHKRDKNVSLKITTRYMSENWFTRYCLRQVISFFYRTNTEIKLQLQIFTKIIEYDEEDRKHLDSLLYTIDHPSKILVLHSLFNAEVRDYIRNLLETTPESILLHVAKNSGFNDAVEFEELHDWIIELNTKLLKCPYIRVKHEASFSLLSNLISHNITLYPLIKDYLSLVALEGKDNDSFISFPILRYLDYFHNYFPNESYSYLVTVFNSNKLEDLCPSPTSNHIFQLIEKLLQANVLPKDHKDRLCSITREFSMRGDPYCKQLANLLMKKYGIT